MKNDRYALRRRRRCLKCNTAFTTIEIKAERAEVARAQSRDRAETMDRYMALGSSARATVRQLITTLEVARQAATQDVRKALAVESRGAAASLDGASAD